MEVFSSFYENAVALKQSLCDAYGCPNFNFVIAAALFVYVAYAKVFSKRNQMDKKVCAT